MFGDAVEQVRLDIVYGLWIAVSVQDAQQQASLDPENEALHEENCTLSRLSFRLPMCENRVTFYSRTR